MMEERVWINTTFPINYVENTYIFNNRLSLFIIKYDPQINIQQFENQDSSMQWPAYVHHQQACAATLWQCSSCHRCQDGDFQTLIFDGFSSFPPFPWPVIHMRTETFLKDKRQMLPIHQRRTKQTVHFGPV